VVILTRSHADSELRSWSLKLREKIGFKRAAAAVARKPAVIIHAMLRSASSLPEEPLPPDLRTRQRLWRDEASLPGSRLVHSAADVAPRAPARSVRNEHWKDRPAKPHDAAAHADLENDHPPVHIASCNKALARPAIKRRPLSGRHPDLNVSKLVFPEFTDC
jgi:hypothetical protein